MEVSKIFTGSPTSVSHKKALKLARDEKLPLFKARRMSLSNECTLDEKEIFITYKRLETNMECAMVLAKLGCSEEVLVAEGLGVLEKVFDDFLESEVSKFEFRLDCALIFSLASKGSFSKLLLFEVAKHKKANSVPLSKEEGDALSLNIGGTTGGICKFVQGLVLAGNEVKCCDHEMFELRSKVQRAAKTSGAQVFKNVLLNMMEVHDDTKNLFANPLPVFTAWSEVYERRINRNIKSHPFLMIQSDVETEKSALSAFEYLINSYTTLQPLMQATVPLICDNLKGLEERTKVKRTEHEKDVGKAAKLLGFL